MEMIKTEKVMIKLNSKHIGKYMKRGYKGNVNDIIEINIKDVSYYSIVEVKAECDVCGKIIITNFKKYNDNISNCGYYSCGGKCSTLKNKTTNLKKYGAESFTKTKEYKEKSKTTCLERYGTEYSSQSEKVKKKIKATNLELYGVEHPLQNKNILKKTKETNLKKYGVENPFQSEKVKNKIKQSNLELYGVEHPTQNENIQKKIKTTNLKKYGVENTFQTKECREIVKSNCLEKYGVNHPSRIEENKESIILKTRNTNEEMGRWIKLEDLTEWEIYYNKVRSLTSKNAKELYQNWNGYDYYDETYIKNNNIENSDKAKCPSIDHKKSVFYCFNNKIPIEEVAALDNLCITKISLNSQKGKLNEDEYVLKYCFK